MDNFDAAKDEIKSISNFFKRIFKVDFNFQNGDFVHEKDIVDTFKEDRVVFEDLEGNPLQLQYLNNLKEMSTTNSVNKNELPKYKSLFNLRTVKRWISKDYYKHYMKTVLQDKVYKTKFLSQACLLDGKFEIRGISESNLTNHIKILRVTRNNRCVLKSSNKLKISELITDPTFKDSYKNVEAIYIFPSGEFQVLWENCYNVFDWPDLNADCNITIKLDPEIIISSIGSLKSELQQLKILISAVEDDLVSWTLVDPCNEGLTVDQFKIQLASLLQNKGKIILAKETEWPTIGNNSLRQRDTDITEDLWSLFKNISSKSVYKQCINNMMNIFQENISKVQLNPSNKTEFYRMLSERFLKSECKTWAFMTSLDILVEVGLHKITKDLIAIISEECPDLSQDDISEIFTKCCLVGDLLKGVNNVNNVYNCVLILEIFKDLFNPMDFKKIALVYVRKLITCLSENKDFQLQHSLTTKMRSVNCKLRSLSSVWIVNFVSTYPFRNERSVVFEVENVEGDFHVYRHDLDLADVQMFC